MSKDTKQAGVRYKYVQFARPIRAPGTGMLDSLVASEHTDLSRVGDDLVVRMVELKADVVVPWSNVLFAWVES